MRHRVPEGSQWVEHTKGLRLTCVAQVLVSLPSSLLPQLVSFSQSHPSSLKDTHDTEQWLYFQMNGSRDFLNGILSISCSSKTEWSWGCVARRGEGDMGPLGSFSCGPVSLLAPTPSNTNKIDDNN